MKSKTNIVLVHGAWADGSSWGKVIPFLQQRGFNVTAAQIPLTSLIEDITVTRNLLAAQKGPTVLAGHSYAGVVISGAANDAPRMGATVRKVAASHAAMVSHPREVTELITLAAQSAN